MRWFTDEEFINIQEEIVISCVDSLVCDQHGNILLGLRCKDPIKDWWLFGGRMSVGEDFELTARRCLDRELGIKSFEWVEIVGHYILNYPIKNLTKSNQSIDKICSQRTHMLTVPRVKVDHESIDTSKLSRDEHLELTWFTPRSLNKLQLHPYLRKVLEDAQLVKPL